MPKHIPDTDREAIIRVINGVFRAEHEAESRHHIAARLKAREITPEEYVDIVADVFIDLHPESVDQYQ